MHTYGRTNGQTNGGTAALLEVLADLKISLVYLVHWALKFQQNYTFAVTAQQSFEVVQRVREEILVSGQSGFYPTPIIQLYHAGHKDSFLPNTPKSKA